MKSNPERMQKRLDTIASFTEEPGRITRRTYSQAWVQAVDYVKKEMEDLGMTTRMDSFGNLIGNYNPGNSSEKPVAIGSHIDSVINAGKYDGVTGIVVGLEIVSMLHENNILPKVPIEVIATAEEEGAVCQKGYFGGRFMTGDMTIPEYLSFRNIDGKNLEDLRKESGVFEGVPFGEDNGWAKGYYQRYYEVHVEQGATLYNSGKQIGVVLGVVGIGRIFVDFFGESDHAGPTMMDIRKDSMVAASDFTLKAWEVGQKLTGKAVTTVGRIQNYPNMHNVIPGKTSLVLDYRSSDDGIAADIHDEMKAYALSMKEKYGVGVEITQEIYTPVKLFAKSVVDDLRGMNFPDSMELYSWAGHDAKAYANITDTGMLFLPSVNGKSHCPQEYTDIKSFELACDSFVNLFV